MRGREADKGHLHYPLSPGLTHRNQTGVYGAGHLKNVAGHCGLYRIEWERAQSACLG